MLDKKGRNVRKTVPSGSYLMPVDRQIPQSDKRCEHQSPGQWLVEWEDMFYAIQPSNNLQKDIWVGEAEKTIGTDQAINALRWLCHTCGTIQIP